MGRIYIFKLFKWLQDIFKNLAFVRYHIVTFVDILIPYRTMSILYFSIYQMTVVLYCIL